MNDAGTIVALSTPPGRSGIGVIRMSGRDALTYARTITQDPSFNPHPNYATLKSICDPDTQEVIDRALLTYFKAPASFTGEDVVELSCHGSPALLTRIVECLLSLGARAAGAGEFTLRAVSNGRLDLSQAEAIRDLIDAQTYASVKCAARQMGGELSLTLQPLKDDIVNIIVPLESSIEFVEDDLPADIVLGIRERIARLAHDLDALSKSYSRGRLLKNGLRATLIGRPNAGKSSLFNKLLRTERAIVTDVPGTTRDTLDEAVLIRDIPVRLTDTAGIRSSDDVIEKIGIERTRQAISDSDFVIVVVDGTEPVTSEDREILEEASTTRHLIALNKSDLSSYSRSFELANGSRVVEVSAKTGTGIEELCDAIINSFSIEDSIDSNFVITNARHYDLLSRAVSSLHSAGAELESESHEELVLVGLYDALRYLGQITGETTSEDVLTQIFATFCIGK